MREVSIHFEDVVIALLQTPSEAGKVGSSQPQLSGSFYQEQPVREFSLQFLDDGCCSVRRSIIDHKNIE